jgi:hypothetical protein
MILFGIAYISLMFTPNLIDPPFANAHPIIGHDRECATCGPSQMIDGVQVFGVRPQWPTFKDLIGRFVTSTVISEIEANPSYFFTFGFKLLTKDVSIWTVILLYISQRLTIIVVGLVVTFLTAIILWITNSKNKKTLVESNDFKIDVLGEIQPLKTVQG